MAVAALSDIDMGLVEDEVGPRSFQRGVDYSRRGRVLRLAWDGRQLALTGRVVGRGGLYQTAAYFEEDDAGWLVFLEGDCSCPVGFNCKHVAAIVVAAGGPDPTIGKAGSRAPASLPRASAGPPAVKPPSWEQSLQELLGSPVATAEEGETPLAIELRVDPGTAGSSMSRWLTATIVRRGGRGGKDWVNGGLGWGSLNSWQVENGNYLDDHLRVLRQLYALYGARAANGAHRFYYSSGGSVDKVLDFSAFDRSLWALLDEANRVGVRLLHASGPWARSRRTVRPRSASTSPTRPRPGRPAW